MQVEMGSCILHQKGRLAVEGCILTCKAGGLAHLFHPLVTSAVGSARTGTPPPPFPNAAPAASTPAAAPAGHLPAQHVSSHTSVMPSSSVSHAQLSLPASAASTVPAAPILGSARVGGSQSSGSVGPPHMPSNTSPTPPHTPALQPDPPCPTSSEGHPCSTAGKVTHSAADGTVTLQQYSFTLQASCSTQQSTHSSPLHSDPLHMQQDGLQDPPSALFSNAGDSIRPSLPFAAMPPAPRVAVHSRQGLLPDSGGGSAVVGAYWKRPGQNEAGSQPLVNNPGKMESEVCLRLPRPAGTGFRGVGRLSVVETKIRVSIACSVLEHKFPPPPPRAPHPPQGGPFFLLSWHFAFKVG